MANPASLRPFGKGEAWQGNRKGRPKGLNSKDVIHKILSIKQFIPDPASAMMNPGTEKKKKVNQLEVIMLKVLEQARKGNLKAVELLLDRMEGRPAQTTMLTDPDGGSIIPKDAFTDKSDSELKELLRKNMEMLGGGEPEE